MVIYLGNMRVGLAGTRAVDIVQETGTSVSSVMSQNATTEAINASTYNSVKLSPSFLFDTPSTYGVIESVESFTFESLKNVSIVHKYAGLAGNFFGISPLLQIYVDDKNYFGLEKQSYSLIVKNVANNVVLNTETDTSGVGKVGTYANVYFSIDFISKKLVLLGLNNSTSAIETIWDIDFSNWDLSNLNNFKIRVGAGKYFGYEYNAYVRINDYYDYSSILEQQMYLDTYNVLPVKANGDVCYNPDSLSLGGTITQTISPTHKISNGSLATENYFALFSVNDKLANSNSVGSFLKFKITNTSGDVTIKNGAGIVRSQLMDSQGNILSNLTNAYTLSPDTEYYLFQEGDTSRNVSYQKLYSIRMQGTFTIEAEALFTGYPRSINLCAETFNGKYFSGAIPFHAKNISFTGYTNWAGNNKYYIPIGAIRIDSNNNMFMFNGTMWKQISN